MAKNSKAERVASAGSRVAGRGIGAALSSPFGIAGLGLAAIIILIVIFRKDIGGFFAGLKFPELPSLPDITFPSLPDINFPEINFPDFPEINLPDFTGLFEGFQEQQNTFLSGLTNLFGGGGGIPKPTKVVQNTGLIDLSQCQCGSTITQDAFGNVESKCKTCAGGGGSVGMNPALLNEPSDAELFASQDPNLTPAQQFVNENNQQGLIVPFNDPLNIGGGGSFIGGTTTFGDENNIIDTLSEVLNIFPNLTASQAADALAENPNLTGNQFAAIDPDIINISSAGVDPDQIINNSSGGFSGLTPQQIAAILTGGNISNF